MPNREMTELQHKELDRICASPADRLTTVVGWLKDGPVLRIKDDLAVLRPSGVLNAVEGLPDTDGEIDNEERTP